MAATTPRKTPAKKATAAVAARREVRSEKASKAAPMAVKFRGDTFQIPRDRLGSARVFMRMQHLRRFNTVASEVDVLFEVLGRVDSARFIDLCGPDDTIESAYSEFMDALNKAGNVPNS